MGRFEPAIYQSKVQSANHYTMGWEDFQAEFNKMDSHFKS